MPYEVNETAAERAMREALDLADGEGLDPVLVGVATLRSRALELLELADAIERGEKGAAVTICVTPMRIDEFHALDSATSAERERWLDALGDSFKTCVCAPLPIALVHGSSLIEHAVGFSDELKARCAAEAVVHEGGRN